MSTVLLVSSFWNIVLMLDLLLVHTLSCGPGLLACGSALD